MPWPGGPPSQEQQVHLSSENKICVAHHIHRVKEENHTIMEKNEEFDEIP